MRAAPRHAPPRRHQAKIFPGFMMFLGSSACLIARIAPTAMIFVPCERGISHNEAENAKPDDLAAGARVLTAELLELANR